MLKQVLSSSCYSPPLNLEVDIPRNFLGCFSITQEQCECSGSDGVTDCFLWELEALCELESHRSEITPSSRFGYA